MRDLPVIENMDLYEVADSVEFLRQLEKTGLFAEEADDEPEAPCASRAPVTASAHRAPAAASFRVRLPLERVHLSALACASGRSG